jgi:hypothetical protein
MTAATTAVEVTAEQAWFLGERLAAGAFPWRLAITAPYTDPGDRERFDARCAADLTAQDVMVDGHVDAGVAASIRAVCRARHWLEWVTVAGPDQVLRGVLARDPGGSAVAALRYAQMLTLTPLEVDYAEALVPIVTAGLAEQRPARFTEFTLAMDLGVAVDRRIAAGADIAETLAGLGLSEGQAQIMEMARTGDRTLVEITAHELTEHGARRDSDVCVNIINSNAGRILVAPPAGEPRAGGESVFAPAEPLAIAVALRDLTARMPSGSWFPDESFDF